MTFASDNWAGAAPEIIGAIAKANESQTPAYGGDELTAKVEAKFADVFETECAVFFVATGGAANGLALSVMTPPYGMIFCHEESHIQMDECAGPEFLTGGAKLLPIAGKAGKLTPDGLQKAIAGFPHRPPHGSPGRVLSLTQASECGTVYSADEVRALCDIAHKNDFLVHMDGARFANAVVSSGESAAALSWQSGVNVLSFGATKNGCLAAEAVVFFDKSRVKDFEFRRKRAGHLLSKTRFISAQFDAYLHDGLWLGLARQANEMAHRLSSGLEKIGGVEIAYPTDINEVFVCFPDGVANRLRQRRHVFYPWITPGDPANGRMQRLICSFRTTADEVDGFLVDVRHACSA